METNSSEDAPCTGCGSERPTAFFEVPRVPANVGTLAASRHAAKKARCGEIRLVACEACGLIQNQRFQVEVVGFQPGYEVSLLHTPTFRNYIKAVCDRLIDRFDLNGKDILEIGCGNGEFLELICAAGNNHGIGIDPTIPAASERTVGGGSLQLIPGFFTSEHHRHFGDFVCCLSVFEDIPQPLEFLRSLRAGMQGKQIPVYFEVFNGFRSITEREVWSIHYEQCNYFGLQSLTSMFQRAGFEITDSGTCYQGDQYLYVEAVPIPTESIEPADFGWMQPSIAGFADEFQVRQTYWDQTLTDWRRDQKRVVVWGSGGKGISLLTSIPDASLIEYVVDVNPDRQGHFIPITGQEIVAPSRLVDVDPDVVIVTNPLYLEEIRDQISELGIQCQCEVA